MTSALRCLPVALATLLGCATSEGETAARRFVGTATGDVFIGIVLDDRELFAYACDGTPAGITVSSWLVGTVDGDAFEAENPAGSTLSGQLVDDGVEGTFTASMGAAVQFMAEPASAPSGLYFGERGHGAEEIWGGWIVIGAEQRGAVVDRTTGDIVGSPSIDPAAPSVDVEGAPLEYEDVEAPLGEDVDEVPPG